MSSNLYIISKAEHTRLQTALEALATAVSGNVSKGWKPVGSLSVTAVPVSPGQEYYVVCQPMLRGDDLAQ
ncbi:hypothetical protein [Cupriavidus sp. D39]|uniref:hypothetical protein n=1 Tax=Cupriavidus sp. D39 TaxID=2997877 RepID=UPI00226E863A|nr:hypothetical protein [Cupriavidus sp. D39]MCY0853089.1 hypothetical protein [Cupriavidus sp. D39]